MNNARLYAAYIEITKDTASGDRRRKQWLILPPLPTELAPQGYAAQTAMLYFHREQESKNNRVAWKHDFDRSGSLARWMRERIDRYTAAGWQVSPVMTCEVHPLELARLIQEPKTPYKVLERIQRVAKAKHNLAI